jgi:L,D-transpeptidase YcbB
MNRIRSWLLNSAASSQNYRPSIAPNKQFVRSLAAGLGVAGLVLIGTAPIALAQTTDARIEGVPVPEPANVPPITLKDLDPKASGTAASEKDTTGTATQTATPAPTTIPASSAPAANAATEPAPGPTPEEIKKLTGKDLIKAPLATSLATADQGIAEKVRETLAGKAERLLSRREDRAVVEVFYRDRGFAPLWIEKGARAARTDNAAKYLATAGNDGLDPSDYPVPNFAAADAQSLAEAELRFTNSVLDYVRHADTGRVHFTRVSGDIHYHIDVPDTADALAKLAATNDAASILASHLPQHEAYKALKAKLAEARGQPQVREPDVVRIPEGSSLKPGVEDARVALLRKRLNVTGDLNDWRYDRAVAEAVANFQQSAGLNADGLAGPVTIRALNGNQRRTTNKVDAILATMERWRWMPHDLGRNHSILNIPDFTLKVMKNGSVAWQTRVVVGKPNMQTPLISDTMKFITVNPTWNVPPSIIANEYLPALQQDPTVLDRMGLRIEENRDGTVRIYQPPGDSNALGRLRFNFPNKFLVYQHDTPDKNLFSKEVRAYSHGCMRVENPVRYAEVLLSITQPKENYTQDRIRSMFGPGELNINFPQPLPVHITYQTAFVDSDGQLQVRDDVYGHDARLMAIMRGSERRIADQPIARAKTVISREELRMPNGMYYGGFGSGPGGGRRYGGGGGYGNNPFEDFFRQIFR